MNVIKQMRHNFNLNIIYNANVITVCYLSMCTSKRHRWEQSYHTWHTTAIYAQLFSKYAE
jgi:hypothetical protein